MASLFRNMPTKYVTLLHQDGRVTPRLKALINTKGDNVTILLEGVFGLLLSGDRIETTTDEGMTLSYRVTDPGFHPKRFGTASYYNARVEKEGAYYRSPAGKVYASANPAAGQAADTPSQRQAEPGLSSSGALLFETLRVFAASQEDSQALLFFIREMEQAVGTPHYPALYDAFIQTIAGRIPQFAYFIPPLSHLLLQSGSSS